MKKKVSVIIPCHNVAKWLPQCFLSLVQQTIGIECLELFFVDDASTDDGATWTLLEEFERAFPQSIAIIHLEENKRQGGARNVALQYVSGEYIAFVDADDWVELNLFENVLKKAKETDADIVQFNHKYYSAKAGIVDNPCQMQENMWNIDTIEKRKRLLLSEEITYGCWNKIYKKKMLDTAGVRFAEGVIYEEPLFVYPLLYYGTKFVIMSEQFYIYRQNDSGTMRKDMKEQQTLFQHADVQLQVWQFMKKTPCFKVFYEEIKLYFLHTYLYEILFFAKQRMMEIPFVQYMELIRKALEEVPDMEISIYNQMIPRQIALYRLAKQGLTEDDFDEIVKEIYI